MFTHSFDCSAGFAALRETTSDGERAHSITLDQRDLEVLARPLLWSFPPAAIFDSTSSFCSNQKTTNMWGMSVVVCHMRVLDSYSDWLWTSAKTARRRLGGAHSQTTYPKGVACSTAWSHEPSLRVTGLALDGRNWKGGDSRSLPFQFAD